MRNIVGVARVSFLSPLSHTCPRQLLLAHRLKQIIDLLQGYEVILITRLIISRGLQSWKSVRSENNFVHTEIFFYILYMNKIVEHEQFCPHITFFTFYI